MFKSRGRGRGGQGTHQDRPKPLDSKYIVTSTREFDSEFTGKMGDLKSVSSDKQCVKQKKQKNKTGENMGKLHLAIKL